MARFGPCGCVGCVVSGTIPEWIGTVLTIIAATMVSFDLGRRITGFGFAVFALSSVFWLVVAKGEDQPGLLLTNSVLLVINLIGVWRWLVLRKPA